MTKNILIFSPMLTYSYLSLENIEVLIHAFISLSFFQFFIYIKNDINDIVKDRNHPIKKNRPIASGKISIKEGRAYSYLFLFLAVFISIDSIVTLSYLLLYYFFFVNYSCTGKMIPVLDSVFLSFFHIIRIGFGFILISEQVPQEVMIYVFGYFFLMSFEKRYKERQISPGFRFKEFKFIYKERFRTFLYILTGNIVLIYLLFSSEETVSLVACFISFFLLKNINPRSDDLTKEVFRDIKIPISFVLSMFIMAN